MTNQNPASAKPKQQTGFTRAALAYMDTLLDLQHQRHEADLADMASRQLKTGPTDDPDVMIATRPSRHIHILASDPAFDGGGWAPPESAGHETRRWMQRLAGLLLFADLSKGGQLVIEGRGWTRKRFLRGLHVELAGMVLSPSLSSRWSGVWRAVADVPETDSRGPHVLTLTAPGQARRYILAETRASLAVSRVTFSQAGLVCAAGSTDVHSQ